jgi:hypothetical protein
VRILFLLERTNVVVVVNNNKICPVPPVSVSIIFLATELYCENITMTVLFLPLLLFLFSVFLSEEVTSFTYSLFLSFDKSLFSPKALNSRPRMKLRDVIRLQASSGREQHHHHYDHNDDERTPAMNEIRRARLAKESSTSNRFASGEELKSLREDLESLRHNLDWAKALKDELRIHSLEQAIKNGQNRDPLFMYSKALRIITETRKMKDFSEEERVALVEKWSAVASAAREVLPEFTMEGLWIGK